ncbi:RNA methyltransferase (plasmid) [Legionella adelaidensis]|uniref:tRNA (cytidine/uridine-2'-O-)-methyltransferase TrmJ n=1 Tax=Legionella adelaidensis TaxID=45056 RepID=A0A0W0R518_9GAMM|nr:RNA methyltransferase [Legionella adelaidensis]KTC66114.1 RNA methyltransferase [Legionella adelaidensis]VEH85816.1 RNA methyltransferase [Legionella adelaidensis]
MNLSNIRIILIATTHPGNIGSTARAMKTMGLSDLYLVAPKMFPHLKAYEMAAGAEDILHAAKVVPSLSEALKDCEIALATSARAREIGLPGFTPSQAASFIAEQKNNSTVAIVFGREHAGLTNEELLQCQYHINIPSNPEYSSLNLSQAVQIIAYEIRMKCLNPEINVATNKSEKATLDEIEQFHRHLQEVLLEIGFLKPSNPKKLIQRLRRLFNRAKLEKIEVNILRGILSQVQYCLQLKKRDE